MPVARKILRAAHDREVQNLGYHASDAIISGFYCKESGLSSEVSELVVQTIFAVMVELTRLAPALLPAKTIFSGLIFSSR